MKVINIFGGPGSGKSTLAHGLMYYFKINGFKVEMAFEYAKELVYDKRFDILENDQYSIFIEQSHRVERYNDGSVDIVIVDCPILVSLVYTQDEYFKKHPDFEMAVINTFNSYDNLNIFLERTVEYVPEGRIQKNIEDAREFDVKMHRMLNKHSISYRSIDPVASLASSIFESVRSTIILHQ